MYSLRVRKRFAEIRAVVQFSSLENLAAVEAFDILGIVIFGDQARSGMLAGHILHNNLSTKCNA
ncbi:MAG: hypothetical protein WCC03_11250 [Candidatus Acidiferrales bacterium]